LSGPDWLPGFSLAVDYYDIEIDKPIGLLGTDFILASCASRGVNCDKIDRFPDGNVSLVRNLYQNVGALESSGVDLLVTYLGIPAFWGGEIDFRFDGTYVSQHDVTQADGTVIKHAGWFRDGQDGHFARVRFVAGVDYRRGGLRASYDLRYIQDVREMYPDLLGGSRQRTVEGRTYHDMQLAYDMERIQTSFILGVDNLLDKEPPFSLDGFNDNTDVRTFDTVGRFLYFRFTRLF